MTRIVPTVSTFLIDSALKAMIWERAKGELRALTNVQGSYSTGTAPGAPEAHETTRWKDLEKCVEEFIKIVENNGLHE